MANTPTPIRPTRAERTLWKDYLRNTCEFLATERPEFYPRKRDSMKTMLELFLSWAHNYNDGYFTERDDAPTDRYSQWLVEQYEIIYGPYDG